MSGLTSSFLFRVVFLTGFSTSLDSLTQPASPIFRTGLTIKFVTQPKINLTKISYLVCSFLSCVWRAHLKVALSLYFLLAMMQTPKQQNRKHWRNTEGTLEHLFTCI